ncbi:MAG: hypothetical protein JXB49_04655 [Bacteroidales bacterium]|nr:hypothetical protein [Bacteroidales bacterium]
MIITISSIHFEIEDTILNERTISRLKPFSSFTSNINQENLFRVSLSHKNFFHSGSKPEIRLKHLHYQENESEIIIADQSSGLKIDIKNRFMEIFTPPKTCFTAIDFLSDLKLYFSIVILQYGGVLLHSSAVFRDQEAMVFIGESGAGKSTIYDILRSKWQNLNDDINVLMPSDERIKIYSTPFGKNIGSYDNAPFVETIYLLKKSIINKVAPPINQTVILNLMRSSCCFPSSDYFAQKLFDNILNIADLVTIRELCFSRNSSLINFFNSDLLKGKQLCSVT